MSPDERAGRPAPPHLAVADHVRAQAAKAALVRLNGQSRVEEPACRGNPAGGAAARLDQEPGCVQTAGGMHNPRVASVAPDHAAAIMLIFIGRQRLTSTASFAARSPASCLPNQVR